MRDGEFDEFMEGVASAEHDAPVSYGLCRGFPVPMQVRGVPSGNPDGWFLWVPRAAIRPRGDGGKGLRLAMPLAPLLRLNRKVPGQLRTAELAAASAREMDDSPRDLMCLAALAGGIVRGSFEPRRVSRRLHAVACVLARRAGVSNHPRIWPRRTWHVLPGARLDRYDDVATPFEAGRATAAILEEVLRGYMPIRLCLGSTPRARLDARVVETGLSGLSAGPDTSYPLDWAIMQESELRARMRRNSGADLAREWNISPAAISRICAQKGIRPASRGGRGRGRRGSRA